MQENYLYTFAKRIAGFVGVLFVLSLMIFILARVVPGDPARIALGPSASQEQVDAMRTQMGLDRPIPVQYWEWFTRLLSGDWGRSFRDGQPVLSVIGSHLTATLELMGTSALVAVFTGMWVGVLGAIRRYSLFDYLATVGAMVALSIPTFWFGLVTIYVFSVKLGILPAGNRYTIGDRTAGLKRASDGSLNIVMSREEPPSDPATNWLPSPAADAAQPAFRMTIRLYGLSKKGIRNLYDGEGWQLPSILPCGVGNMTSTGIACGALPD